MSLLDTLNRHSRIALSFSGGKDSTACVWMLREHLERITLYHLHTGDLLPEVRSVVDQVRAIAPHFVTVERDVGAWIRKHGLPSDLVPYSSHPTGQEMRDGLHVVVSRYDCCSANLMNPLFARIKADGNTLLIRGSKACDMRRLPVVSGELREGLEFLLPLEAWSDQQVMDYLRDVGAPVSSAYSHFRNLPECATCSAWWSEPRAAYLRRHHPALYRQYLERLSLVVDEVAPSIGELLREIGDTK